MFVVYAIASLNSKYVYVGLTSNLEERLHRHNSRYEKTTKPYAPFVLIYSESLLNRPDARLKEKFLKGRTGKRILYQIIHSNFKELIQFQSL